MLEIFSKPLGTGLWKTFWGWPMVWNKIHRHANGGLTGQSFRDTCATKDVAPTQTHGWGDMTTYYFLILQGLKMVDFFQLDSSITFEIDTRWENLETYLPYQLVKDFLHQLQQTNPAGISFLRVLHQHQVRVHLVQDVLTDPEARTSLQRHIYTIPSMRGAIAGTLLRIWKHLSHLWDCLK